MDYTYDDLDVLFRDESECEQDEIDEEVWEEIENDYDR